MTSAEANFWSSFDIRQRGELFGKTAQLLALVTASSRFARQPGSECCRPRNQTPDRERGFRRHRAPERRRQRVVACGRGKAVEPRAQHLDTRGRDSTSRREEGPEPSNTEPAAGRRGWDLAIEFPGKVENLLKKSRVARGKVVGPLESLAVRERRLLAHPFFDIGAFALHEEPGEFAALGCVELGRSRVSKSGLRRPSNE